MKRLFFLLTLGFLSVFSFAQNKLELYKDMITTDNLRLRSDDYHYPENKILTVLNKGTTYDAYKEGHKLYKVFF